jgi:O-antigen/teichoic acid export membrane protein
MLFWSTDKVILGMRIGTVAVAEYNIGSTFNTILQQLSTCLLGVIVPQIMNIALKKDSRDELSELFVRIGRIQYILLSLVVSGFVVFGSWFIQIWGGIEYANSYYIALFTLIPLLIPFTQNVGLQIMVAQNKHKFRAIVYFAIALLNIISTYLIVPYLGGIGAALCSGICYVIGQGFIVNIYYQKVIGIRIKSYWKNIGILTIIPSILAILFGLVLRKIPSREPKMFIMFVMIYTVFYSIFTYTCTLNQYEKSFFQNFIRRFKLKALGS